MPRITFFRPRKSVNSKRETPFTTAGDPSFLAAVVAGVFLIAAGIAAGATPPWPVCGKTAGEGGVLAQM